VLEPRTNAARDHDVTSEENLIREYTSEEVYEGAKSQERAVRDAISADEQTRVEVLAGLLAFKLGYKPYFTNPNTTSIDPEHIVSKPTRWELASETELGLELLHTVGVPDVFAYDFTDYIFIEAKSENDRETRSQKEFRMEYGDDLAIFHMEVRK